jgi:hypothetical protein
MRSVRGEFAGALWDQAVLDHGDTAQIAGCRRQSARRIDCVVRDEQSTEPCEVLAVILRHSGVVFSRSYGCEGNSKHPHRRHRAWGRAQALNGGA